MNILEILNRIYLVIPLSILILFLLSVPIIYILRRWEKGNKKFWIAAYLLVLIWLLRFLVGFLSGMVLPEEGSGLSFAEELMNSLIHALQTFSMDEDYTDYTVKGKQLLETVGLANWAASYGLLISVLNICAPILGGAILLDILTSLFPKFRLRFLAGKDVFVFSELNEAAVNLAEDICRGDHYKKILPRGETSASDRKKSYRRPVFVFTDAYRDKEEEENSELFDRAKALGAICVREDLKFLSFRSARTVTYLLLDTTVQGNMSTLKTLLEKERSRKRDTQAQLQGQLQGQLRSQPQSQSQGQSQSQTQGQSQGQLRSQPQSQTQSQSQGQSQSQTQNQPEERTKIYVFSEDEIVGSLINSLCARYPEIDGQVLIRTVKSRRNAVMNLMYDVPLFLPLLSVPEQERTDLYVTVLGDGRIAEEGFKAAFWCGQMYGVQLHLNLAASGAKRFEEKLRAECPELLQSCDPHAELLNVYPNAPKQQKNSPYSMQPQFIPLRDSADLSSLPSELIQKTDYFIIAFDSDQENLTAADFLKDQIVRFLLGKGTSRQPVMAVSVFNRVLGEALAEPDPAPAHPKIFAFADTQSRFDCENVFLLNFKEGAEGSANLYDKEAQTKERRDEYTFWSNIAKTVHVPYKLFGIGAVKAVRQNESGGRSEYEYETPIAINERQRQALAWLEHRRWNAFMRTEGFRCPTKQQLDDYYTNPSLPQATHKYVEAKLHVCLVESSVTAASLPDRPDFSSKELDYLDFASMYVHQLKVSDTAVGEEPVRMADFKQYDYPEEDEELSRILSKN